MILKTFAMAVLAAMTYAQDNFSGTVTGVETVDGVTTITAQIDGVEDPVTAQIPDSMTVDIGTVIARSGDEWTVDGEVWTPPASDDGSGDAAASGDASGDAAASGDGSGDAAGDGSGDAAGGDEVVTTEETTDETEPAEGPEYGSNIFGLENAFSVSANVRWPNGVDDDGNDVYREMGELTLANGWILGEGADAETEFFVMLHFMPTEAERAAFKTMTFSWAMSGYTEQEVDGVTTTSVKDSAEVMTLTPIFSDGDTTVIFDYHYADVAQTGTAAHSDLTALTLDNYQFAFGEADGTDNFYLYSSEGADFSGLFEPDSSRSRINSATNELTLYWKRNAAGQAFDLGEDVAVEATVGVQSDKSNAAIEWHFTDEVYFPPARPDCAADEVRLEDLTCGCAAGQEKVDGTCVDECADGEERLDDGSCVAACDQGYVRGDDGVCALDCPEGEEEVDKVCVTACGADQERIDGTCVAACADGEERLDDLTCVTACAAGQERVEGACVAACGANQERVDGICAAACAEGQTRGEDGNCACPEGQEANAAAECVAVCAEGEERNDAGECAKKEGATSVTTFALTSLAAIAALMY